MGLGRLLQELFRSRELARKGQGTDGSSWRIIRPNRDGPLRPRTALLNLAIHGFRISVRCNRRRACATRWRWLPGGEALIQDPTGFLELAGKLSGSRPLMVCLSVRPSRNSITIKGRPSSLSISWMVQMFG